MCSYHNLVDECGKFVFIRILFQLKVDYFEKIYPSLFPHCIKGCQNEQHLLLFLEPSYWNQTFLSTAGTAVPIFLQPCLALSFNWLSSVLTRPPLNHKEGRQRYNQQHCQSLPWQMHDRPAPDPLGQLLVMVDNLHRAQLSHLPPEASHPLNDPSLHQRGHCTAQEGTAEVSLASELLHLTR